MCGEPRLISLACVVSPVDWSLLSCYFIFHDYKSFITNYEFVGFFNIRGRLGLDRMVVGFITTYVIKCLSPLKLWVWISLGRGVIDTTLCDKVYQWLATGRWFPLGTPVSSTNKADYIRLRSRCGRDHMVVGFTATNAISAYHHWCREFDSRSGRGV